jgi:hypothetical protein
VDIAEDDLVHPMQAPMERPGDHLLPNMGSSIAHNKHIMQNCDARSVAGEHHHVGVL